MNCAVATANITFAKNLERLAGIEPVVESLEDSRSAIELQPQILERSAGIEPAPRHWQCRILPLNHDRSNLVDAGEVESPLPVCRTGVLPLSLRAQIWCPVEVSILRLPVCRTGALPSELTGQIFPRRRHSTSALFILTMKYPKSFTTARILVGAKGLKPSPLRVRAGCAAARAPHRWSRRRKSNAGFVRTGDPLCH